MSDKSTLRSRRQSLKTLPRWGLTGLVRSCVLALFLTRTIHAAEEPPAHPATGEAVVSPAAAAAENSVVRIFSTIRYPDFFKPWTKQSPREVSGTGIVIEGNRILTNAHVVSYASQVQVQANQSGDKLAATVEAIAPGMDLAVLKLEDETFFATHAPLPRSGVLPSVKDSVMVYGFPTGGTSLSITKGIVSRIEFAPYNYPVSGLRVQIDAAINHGNSGGPALVGEQMIGLAYSRLGGAENIGYIIPVEEIELFLKDIADGHYDGKPAMYDELQTLENRALRSYLKLDKAVEGIVVHTPFNEDASYPLKRWDVITKIGDTPIDNEGMVKIGPNLRVRFRYLIQKIAKDGRVPLHVIRGGKDLAVDLPVSAKRPMLMIDLEGSYPPYFIIGPVVFSTATSLFSAAASSNPALANAFSALASPLATRRGAKPAFEGEELVVISSPLFPHNLSKGYANPFSYVVKTLNGIPVKNLRHFVEILRDSQDEYIVIEFDMHGGETLVFPRKETLAATEGILSDNGIRAQGSDELLALWNKKAAK